MKKIDLHIHTVATVSDADFSFDLHTMKRYVTEAALDAIAITNHNVFDGNQFAEIEDALDVVVFPGIEVSLDCGHVLVISDKANLDVFKEQAEKVNAKITIAEDRISFDDFFDIFHNLKEYLVIPHYDKNPAIKGEDLERIKEYVPCGEVNSAKKFIRAIKGVTRLTPVLFSDVRISAELESLPTRQTFVDCGDLSLGALKECLRDKGKVALSKNNGNELFPIFDNGQQLSTGLNILLGERSSGKTFTLNKINANPSHGHVKYIKQFSLVQQEDAAYEREYSKKLKRDQSQFIEEYLAGFKNVLNDVMNVDLRVDEREVADYIRSLIESAEEVDRRDAFSNAALFGESEFPISDDIGLKELIDSIRHLIENGEYQAIIVKHIEIQSLKQLAVELIELLREKALERKKKDFVNVLVGNIREILGRHTSAVQVKDVDLYRVILNEKKVERFTEIVKHLQENATISEESIQGFRVVATKGPFAGAGGIKLASGVKTAFGESFKHYEHPYNYLLTLFANESLTQSEYYRLFVNITYRILNKDGYVVSGGERSEFRLLQEINDAQDYDMLLIDEPESSFDNMFLHSAVNQIIREISETMPVVVVTHNSTVGASVGADYLLYASKEIEGGKVAYKLFSGYPTDLSLHSPDGKTISNYEITLNSLEAGCDTYLDRRRKYEVIEDR